jgi:hypothetical protein
MVILGVSLRILRRSTLPVGRRKRNYGRLIIGRVYFLFFKIALCFHFSSFFFSKGSLKAKKGEEGDDKDHLRSKNTKNLFNLVCGADRPAR